MGRAGGSSAHASNSSPVCVCDMMRVLDPTDDSERGIDGPSSPCNEESTELRHAPLDCQVNLLRRSCSLPPGKQESDESVTSFRSTGLDVRTRHALPSMLPFHPDSCLVGDPSPLLLRPRNRNTKLFQGPQLSQPLRSSYGRSLDSKGSICLSTGVCSHCMVCCGNFGNCYHQDAVVYSYNHRHSSVSYTTAPAVTHTTHVPTTRVGKPGFASVWQLIFLLF
jgi:hypothetical protein